MARAPGTKVHTSTQGISRKSYQKGRALGGNIGSIKGPKLESPSSGGSGGKSREYSKKGEQVEGFNVSYGETFHPTDLEDIKNTLKEPPKKGLELIAKPSKSYKK